MVVDVVPPLEDFGNLHPRPLRHVSHLVLGPLSALFKAIDTHSSLQDMAFQAEAAMADDDEVVYYVNRDSQGWVEQHVTRRVYIELKLECTRNRTRNIHKARDDWLCLYCGGSFPSKLRLTDHRLGGCPRGPVNSSGAKWELPVYPNLKTAKQGKDLKLALQRGEGSVWNNLGDREVWLDLNPELRDVTPPPPGTRLQKRWFMEATLETLTANLAPKTDAHRQPFRKPPLPPRQDPAPSARAAFVDLQDDSSDEPQVPAAHSKKRSHAEIAQGPRVYHSKRQFRADHRKDGQGHSRQNAAANGRAPTPPRSGHPSASRHRGPPPHPISVTPIQTRSPSPERAATLPPVLYMPPSPAKHSPSAVVPPSPPAYAPPSPPAAHVPPDALTPPVAPVTRMETPRAEHDLASGLRKERHAFYLNAASVARGTVKMDTPKPPLRPLIQPPGLFHLLACGLLNFDLEHGKFEDFEAQVAEWKTHPAAMDRLFAAYGRFHRRSHRVTCLSFSSLQFTCMRHLLGTTANVFSVDYNHVVFLVVSLFVTSAEVLN